MSKNNDKKYCMSAKMAKKEHERLIPELKKAGLEKEAREQEKDLKEINKS